MRTIRFQTVRFILLIAAVGCIGVFLSLQSLNTHITVVQVDPKKLHRERQSPHSDVTSKERFKSLKNSDRNINLLMKRNVAATPIGRHVVKVQVTGKAEGTPIKSIICSNNQKPKISSKDIQLWQKISGSEDHYVFSAFHDDRRHALRIIAMTSHRSPIQYKCQMWFKNSSSAYHSDANVYNVPETHGLRFTPLIMTCPLPDHNIPYAVSIVRTNCESGTNLMNVLDTGMKNEGKGEFGVCVAPLNERFDNVHRFVEFIEVNRMFGASHFVFYNFTVGPRIEKYLNRYAQDDLVTVVQWPLPVDNRNIHYFGQLAALNDCLYRLSAKRKHIMFADLDEFAVPRIHNNWHELIRNVSDHGKRNYGVYTFLCTFFKIEYPNDEHISNSSDYAYFDVHTVLKMRREPIIFHAGQRSKYIVEAKKIDVVGVHNVWSTYGSVEQFVVPSSLGLLHHYRFWDTPNDKNWVEDKSMHRFSEIILKRIKERFSIMGVTRKMQ